MKDGNMPVAQIKVWDLRIAYIEVGKLRRKELLRIFAWARAIGCEVSYSLHKGFLEDLYTDIVISGELRTMQAVQEELASLLDRQS